ncbi:DUF3857 domain-containing transglutaminase family protein [Puia sp.]|jgi:hypothetical protein|uniref:DUF3857 domain-containing transglutaminase family protein n=1 Tax=Puia sp. TaxID=2045100 RepID=UPI002F4177A1
MSRLFYILLLAIGALPALPSEGQTRSIESKFPGEQEVMLEHSVHYVITLKDGQPLVKSEEKQQLLYLSAQANSRMSRFGFSHSGFHQLEQYSAYTLTADAKKIKVTNFKTTDSKSNSIFYDDVKETTFDFPALAPGAIGTLETTMLDKDPHLLSPFFFSWAVPVIHSQLKITFPKDMQIRYLLKGNDTARIRFTLETRHGETTYTFQADSVAAGRPYDDAPDIRWYAAHVVFYIEKYVDEHGTTIPYLSSPDDLFHLYLGYLKDINKETGPELQHIVDSLCKNAPDPEGKARNIYAWVQQNIKYIAFEQGMEGFVPRDANLVCTRKFGDCKDMSSILTLMLRTAGIPAWYTWIGTRSLPYTYTETPLPLVDNHMISTIRLNDRYIFLDGTDPFCIFGMPSTGIQDKQALVAMDDSTYKILTVPIPAKEMNRLIDTTTIDLTAGGLKGHICIDHYGYYSNILQDLLIYSNEKEIDQLLKPRFRRGSDKFNLDSFRIGDRGDHAHIRLTGDFTLQDYARQIGSEWYINMNLFKSYLHEEIDYPKRTMPIEFPFYGQRIYVVILNIPAGYEVTYLPPGKTYHNAVWGFTMNYEKRGRQLIFTQEFDNDHLLLQPSQFADWNKVLENLFPLYHSTVSLQKNP